MIFSISFITLNSNLILLIPLALRHVYHSLKTLNSNLILLIPEKCKRRVMGDLSCFKFQSDSINTIQGLVKKRLARDFKFQSDSINTGNPRDCSERENTLNSNLILLIRYDKNANKLHVTLPLNSNLILLIQPSSSDAFVNKIL